MKARYERRLLAFIVGVFLVGVLTGWGITAAITAATPEEKNFTEEVQENIIVSHEIIQSLEPNLNQTPEPSETPERIDPPPEPLYSPEEVYAVALTLAGECYDNQPQDKRNVAWVICNRVKDGRFGETIIAVITAPNQFCGYWAQGRSISDNDREIAEEVLAAYYSEEEPIHNYLFFTGGTGTTNNFR